MSTILLSFTPDWFEMLEKGTKKFEYRKHFPKGKTTVYFYVSSPVKAITGIAEFAERELLESWKNKYSARPLEVQLRIEEFLKDCRFAMPCILFQKTNRISLEQIQSDIPNFVVPRMYYYIDRSPLLDYLEKHIYPEGAPLVHSFDEIADDDIC